MAGAGDRAAIGVPLQRFARRPHVAFAVVSPCWPEVLQAVVLLEESGQRRVRLFVARVHTFGGNVPDYTAPADERAEESVEVCCCELKSSSSQGTRIMVQPWGGDSVMKSTCEWSPQ